MSLTWKKPQRWYMASECGRYTVSKSAGADGIKYGAWVLPTAGEKERWRTATDAETMNKTMPLLLGFRDRLNEAQALVQDYHDKNTGDRKT